MYTHKFTHTNTHVYMRSYIHTKTHAFTQIHIQRHVNINMHAIMNIQTFKNSIDSVPWKGLFSPCTSNMPSLMVNETYSS